METLESLFVWLLRASWQASVLVGLVLLAQGVFRQKLSPGWRYSLWLLVVLRLVLPATPQSAVSIFNLAQFRPAPAPHLALPHFDPISPLPAVVPPPNGTTQLTSPDTGEKTTAAPSRVDPVPNASMDAPRSAISTLRRWVPTLWLAGVILLLLRILGQNARFVARIRRQRPVTDSAVLDLLEDCKSVMGVRTPLSVVETSAVKSPALCGFIRPRLLLPENLLASFTPQELRYVFLHELAHVKRFDMAVNWLVTALRVLHWFNPAVWFAFRRLAADRELAADALALSRARDGEGDAYGQTVIKLLESFACRAALPGLIGILEEKRQMKERIAMIAQFKKTAPWPVLAGALLIALGLVSLTDAQIKKDAEELSGQAVNRKTTSSDSAESKTVPSKEPRPFPGTTTGTLTTMRRLELPQSFLEYGEPSISRDGRHIVQQKGNETTVLELATGNTRQVRDSGGIMNPRFSPDGRQVVVGGRSTYPPPHVNELVLIDLETNESRRVFRDGNIANLMPMDWSADGRSVLFVYMELGPGHQWHIATFSVIDGSVRTIKLPERWSLSSFVVAFSPDAKWIVYDMPQSSNTSGPRDLFLLAADGSQEVPLVQHPSDDYVLGWAPIGNWILFSSNRRGTWDAYAMQVVDGKVVGNAVLVKEGIGHPRPFGFTRDGAFVYRISTDLSDVYLATLDPVSGKMQGMPRKMPHRFEGYSTRPDWSHDGRFLTFLSTYGYAAWAGAIYIRDLVAGTERSIEVTQGPVDYPRWSLDGRSLHAMVRDQERTRGIQIDARTGASVVAITNGNFQHVVGWAPDGRSFFYRNFGVESAILRQVESGTETRIPLNTKQATAVSLSPDGKHLAFFDYYFWTPATRTNQTTIFVMRAAGGEKHKLVEKQRVGHFGMGLAWSHDSRFVLFSKTGSGSRAGAADLCRVPVDGGEVEELGVIPAEAVDMCMSPDGRDLAFTVSSRKRDVWVLENFLPKDNVAAK